MLNLRGQSKKESQALKCTSNNTPASLMASFVRHFSRSLLQASRRTPAKRKCNPHRQCAPRQFRPFSSTHYWLAEDNDDSRPPQQSAKFTVEDFTPDERADYELLSKSEQAEHLADINEQIEAFESPEVETEIDASVDIVNREVDQEVGQPVGFLNYRAKGPELGFWGDDEDDEFGIVDDDDEDLNEEDITSVAHSELEVHREMREYARIVAWDMPLLQSTLTVY